MNFESDDISTNTFLRILFQFIKENEWRHFSINLNFKGRKSNEGNGIEAREFYVKLIENKKIKYISPREKYLVDLEKKRDFNSRKNVIGGRKSGLTNTLKRLKRISMQRDEQDEN